MVVFKWFCGCFLSCFFVVAFGFFVIFKFLFEMGLLLFVSCWFTVVVFSVFCLLTVELLVFFVGLQKRPSLFSLLTLNMFVYRFLCILLTCID